MLKLLPFSFIFLLLLLFVGAAFLRPDLPISEPRYLTVAWEMWMSGDYLVPHRNGIPYSDKPPLLFWCINLGWQLFGVNSWWPKLTTVLFGLIALFTLRRISALLWPHRMEITNLSPFVLISIPAWAFFVGFIAFDIMITALALCGIFGLLISWWNGGYKGWLTLGVAIGLGLLAKGPVILAHVLLIALIAPFWDCDKRILNREKTYRKWYAGVALSLLIGASIALVWAIPAAIIGGEDYADAIFFGQSAGRIINSFAHQQPWWWYLVYIIPSLAPWSLLPNFWKFIFSGRTYLRDPGIRFCVTWLLSGLIVFSTISGKQLPYIFPIFPAFSLLVTFSLLEISDIKDKYFNLITSAFIILPGLGILLVKFLPLDMIPQTLREGLNPAWAIALFIAGFILVSMPASNLRINILSKSSLLCLSLLLALLAARAYLYHAQDVTAISQEIKKYEERGYTIAHVGKYQGVYNYAGRLQRPIEILPSGTNFEDWLTAGPKRLLIRNSRNPETLDPSVVYSAPYRGRYVLLIKPLPNSG